MPLVQTYYPVNSVNVGRYGASGGITIVNAGEGRINCKVSFSLGTTSTDCQTFS